MECSNFVYALRGATTVESDNKEEIIRNTKTLYETLLRENNLREEELAFIHFSQTKDIRSINIASALRQSGYAKSVPLFCTEEADTEGALARCIRLLILVAHPPKSEKKMVYLERSVNLRPDYLNKE